MLGSRAFPVRVAGLIHLANRIEVLEPIPVNASLSLFCTLTGPEETPRGQEFSLATTARRRGRPVWRESMRFLARASGSVERSPRRKPTGPPEDAVTLARWGAPSDIGRRYAQVSGDFNPIHLFAGAARLFGFDRAIAHGMWSLARATASLDPDAGCESLVVDARFVKPLMLPGEVELAVSPPTAGAGRQFWLAGASDGPIHLAGTLDCDKAPGRRDNATSARVEAGVS
jgi:acyl dehydratase